MPVTVCPACGFQGASGDRCPSCGASLSGPDAATPGQPPPAHGPAPDQPSHGGQASPTRFSCRSCGAQLSALGVPEVECPSCHAVVPVPTAPMAQLAGAFNDKSWRKRRLIKRLLIASGVVGLVAGIGVSVFPEYLKARIRNNPRAPMEFALHPQMAGQLQEFVLWCTGIGIVVLIIGAACLLAGLVMKEQPAGVAPGAHPARRVGGASLVVVALAVAGIGGFFAFKTFGGGPSRDQVQRDLKQHSSAYLLHACGYLGSMNMRVDSVEHLRVNDDGSGSAILQVTNSTVFNPPRSCTLNVTFHYVQDAQTSLWELESIKQSSSPLQHPRAKPADNRAGSNTSSRVMARVSNADDKAALYANGKRAIETAYGLGPGGQSAGHRPGDSGWVDITSLVHPGDNPIRLWVWNASGCCGVSGTFQVKVGNEIKISSNFARQDSSEGVKYDKTVTLHLGKGQPSSGTAP